MTDVPSLVTLITHASMFFGGMTFGMYWFMARLHKRPKTTKNGTYTFTPREN